MPVLIFDLDDTLYDLARPQLQAMRIVYGDRLPELSDEQFVAFRKYSDERFDESQSGRISMEEMYIYRIKRTLQDIGVDTTKEEALEFQRVYTACQREITLSPVVSRMLSYLKENNVKMAVISNGKNAHQMNKVKALELTKWIPEKYIFISENLEYAKPDERIFTTVAKILEIENEEKYYFGDSFLNDVIAPKKAGWKTVWYNHRDYVQDDVIKPDFTVYTEEEMLQTVIEIVQ